MISTNYINESASLEFICDECQKHFFRDWAHLKRKRFSCKQCANKNKKNNRLTIEDVKDFLKEYDVDQECRLLSKEYINISTPLSFQCNLCGSHFERNFAHVKRMHFHCPKCGISMGAKKLQYTEEMVDKEIAKKGLQKSWFLYKCRNSLLGNLQKEDTV